MVIGGSAVAQVSLFAHFFSCHLLTSCFMPARFGVVTVPLVGRQEMTDSYHEDVIGSHVVYDPTGRDLASCMEVGRVIAVTWDSDDDGNADGPPRPLLVVQPNGTTDGGATVAVTVVHSIIAR